MRVKTFSRDFGMEVKEIITISSRLSIFKYLKKCFHYKELTWALVKKDLKVKYAQTNLGLLLSLLQPVVSLLLFSFFFGHLMKLGSDGSPYPVFVFIGLTSWYCFSYIVGYASSSLIESNYLIKKVYFPKLILPVSKALGSLIEFLIWTGVLVVLMIIYDIPPTFRLIYFPLFLLMNFITGLTIAIWLSALSFRRRDILHIIPYMAGLTIIVTPVFYPNTIIPEHLSYLLYCNPIAGIIQGFRWCITGVNAFDMNYLPGFLVILILFFLSIWYFKNVEYRMAEQL
jgi:lipopolysaccharide transport system permease protein